jgi:hypothetical protein
MPAPGLCDVGEVSKGAGFTSLYDLAGRGRRLRCYRGDLVSIGSWLLDTLDDCTRRIPDHQFGLDRNLFPKLL